MSKATKTESIPRREFIRRVGIGTAGAAVSLSAGGLGSEALAGRATEVGTITLDGIFITYFPAPLGTPGFATCDLLKNYSTTLGLRIPDSPQVLFAAKVPAGQERLT